jgi:hypothetical protein
MSTRALHPPHRLRPARVLAHGSFAIMLAGWLAFAYALIASQDALADVWGWVTGLPLIPELAVWLVGFPFLLGLAIWEASWSESARVILIGVIAVAYLLMFRPRKDAR